MSRFGLDLGRYSVKLVRCDKGQIQSSERVVDPALEGPERHAALVTALKEAAGELNVRARDELHVAVPRASAIVKHMTLPPVDDPAELEQMIRFQAARGLPFELDEMVLAWGRPIGPDGPSKDVLFAAVRRPTLDELTAVVEEAGLRPGSLEISTQAAARAVALLGSTGGEVVLIEVGHTSSDVLFLKDGRLLFSRSASVGCGSEPARTESAIVRDWRARLVNEVVRTLVAARTEVGGSERVGAPDALLIAGGGASDELLRERLQEQLSIAPEVLSGLGDEETDIDRAARFVVARGLADPREVPGIPMLDLANRRQAQETQSTRRRFTGVAVVAAVTIVALIVGAKVALDGRESAVATLEAERAQLASDVKRAKRIKAELKRAEEWDARKGRELEVLLAVSKALPDDERAYLTQFRWVEDRPLRLTGRAKAYKVVGSFLSQLEQHPLVLSAKPESIQKPKQRGLLGVDFTSEVRLVGKEVKP